MYSLKGKKGIAILVPMVALILMVVIVKPAYADQLSPGDFTDDATLINFNDAPDGPIEDTYFHDGVTFVDMYGGTKSDTGTGTSNPAACNFPSDGSGSFPPGELLFDPPVVRAGFFITTIDSDDTFVAAFFMGGIQLGSETIDTGGGFAGGSFAGVEFGSPFDRLLIDPADTALGAFCMDDLRFDEAAVTNVAPDCTKVVPSAGELSSTNHKMQSISLSGATDVDGDSISYTIDSIFQDEEVRGDPDGEGVGTDIARVRAERSSKGDGRVYVISYTASDDKGGKCSSSVSVGVPHDKSGAPAVNNGAIFDSTGD